MQARIERHAGARAARANCFRDYRVWDTEENCGVLMYVNLADHQVEIVADRGVGRVVAAKEWQAVCRTMTQGLRARRIPRQRDRRAQATERAACNSIIRTTAPSRNQLSDKPDRAVILRPRPSYPF